jgi:hypothetical protein
LKEESSQLIGLRMDPVTCLSVASTVTQFIDFAFKIYSGTRQLYVFAQAASSHSMIPAALECSLHRYLQLKMEHENVLNHSTLTKPALDYVLVPTHRGERFISARMVKLLIGFGANPNKRFNGYTPFENFLSYIAINCERFTKNRSVVVEWSEILFVLLENGADPTTTCQGPEIYKKRGKRKVQVQLENEWSISEVINTVFTTLPSTATNLERLLQQTIRARSQKKSGTDSRFDNGLKSQP